MLLCAGTVHCELAGAPPQLIPFSVLQQSPLRHHTILLPLGNSLREVSCPPPPMQQRAGADHHPGQPVRPPHLLQPGDHCRRHPAGGHQLVG